MRYYYTNFRGAKSQGENENPRKYVVKACLEFGNALLQCYGVEKKCTYLDSKLIHIANYFPSSPLPAEQGIFDKGPDHVSTSELQLKVNCRKKFGLACPNFILQFTFSCNSLVHYPSHSV